MLTPLPIDTNVVEPLGVDTDHTVHRAGVLLRHVVQTTV